MGRRVQSSTSRQLWPRLPGFLLHDPGSILWRVTPPCFSASVPWSPLCFSLSEVVVAPLPGLWPDMLSDQAWAPLVAVCCPWGSGSSDGTGQPHAEPDCQWAAGMGKGRGAMRATAVGEISGQDRGGRGGQAGHRESTESPQRGLVAKSIRVAWVLSKERQRFSDKRHGSGC